MSRPTEHLDAKTEERLFLEFRERREPALLGALFDRVADELYAVALHLAGDRNDAEDLLQATFLVAIERARRFDARRPLRPWLLGILHREAKVARRRRRRAPDPDRVASPREVRPLQQALDTEAVAQVTAAIADLPAPYRDVLELHLLDALPSGQIAARLGRSPGAVRTQLWRGLGMLRGLLPRGLAVGLAAHLGSGTARAATRASVVEAAAGATRSVMPAAAVTAAASLGGYALIGAAVVAVAVSGWILWPGGSTVTRVPVTASKALDNVTPDTGGSAPRREHLATEPPSGPRRAAEAAVGQEDGPDGQLVARLEVVDAAGDPVPDAEVLQFPPAVRGALAGARRPGPPLGRTRTDLHGRAEVRFSEEVFVHARKPGVGTSGDVRIGRETHGLDGVLRLPLLGSVQVRGTVLDVSGAPAAGASVRSYRNSQIPNGLQASAPPTFQTESDGRFVCEVACGGAYTFYAMLGRSCSERVQVEVPEDAEGARDIVLRFPGAFSIRGTLRGSEGRPARGRVCLVTNPAGKGDPHGPSRNVDAQGVFEFRLAEGGTFAVVGGAAGLTSACARVVLDATRPHREVELRLTPFVPVAGRAVDEGGAPLAGLKVSAYPCEELDAVQRCRLDLQGMMRGVDTGIDGGFRLMVPADQRCRVRYHPSRRLSVTGMEIMPPGEGLTLRVSEREKEGFRISGTVVAAATGAPVLVFRVYLVTQESPGSLSDGRIASSTDGRFDVGPLPVDRRYWLRIEAEGLARTMVGPFDATRRRETRVVRLPRPARLSCTVLRPDGTPARNAWVALLRGSPFEGYHRRSDGAGNAEFEGLPPGDYEVVVRAELKAGGKVRGRVSVAAGSSGRMTLRLER